MNRKRTMETPMQTVNESPLAAFLPASAPIRTQARILQVLIEAALDAGRDARLRAQRVDGWTPERIHTFLAVLAQRGVVAVAAQAAGISAKSAYALRNSPKGFAFAAAWEAALHLARERLIDQRPSRVLHGVIKPIIRNGRLWGIRHRHDNRAAMGALTRLDRTVGSVDAADRALVAFADDFEALVEIVSSGGEAAEAMIEERLRLLGHSADKTGTFG
jgi:hypothetical protein